MRRLILFSLTAFLLMGGVSHAAESNAVPAAKIGVVDVQAITTESDPAKAANEQLEAKYGKERAAIEKQGNALKKQAESLKNPKTSDAKRADFIKAKQKLDNDTRNFLRKVEQDQIKLNQDMVTLVFSAAYKVAKAKGFNFVVDVNGGGVLYADASMDLTKDVLAEVNKLYNEKKGGNTPASEEKKSADPNQAPAEKTN